MEVYAKELGVSICLFNYRGVGQSDGLPWAFADLVSLPFLVVLLLPFLAFTAFLARRLRQEAGGQRGGKRAAGGSAGRDSERSAGAAAATSTNPPATTTRHSAFGSSLPLRPPDWPDR